MVHLKLPLIARFGFHHDEPELFFTTQWTKSVEKNIFFLIFRWILSAFFIGIVAYSWTSSISYGYFDFWFIYMTNWGILLCMISTTFAAILTTCYHFDLLSLNPQSWPYKVFWFLSNVSTVLAFMITVVYWTVLFEGRTSTIDVLVHGGNSAGMMVQLLVVRHPMYFFHVVYSLAIGIVYLIFSIIYYFAGGVDSLGRPYIYNVLSWEEPLNASLVAIGVMILSIFLHLMASVIQTCRYRVHKKYLRKPEIINNSQQLPV